MTFITPTIAMYLFHCVKTAPIQKEQPSPVDFVPSWCHTRLGGLRWFIFSVLTKRRLRKIEEKLSHLENDRRGFDIRMELYQLLKEYYDIFSTEPS